LIADRADFRKVVIASILGTDMSRHQELSDRITAHIASRRRPSGSSLSATSGGVNAADEMFFDCSNATSRELFGIAMLKVRACVLLCVCD
jgi:hypothetical protein